ncbi:MAG: hypothetical protein AMXMBFR13_20030 [Phycisphaerae bacterium]
MNMHRGLLMVSLAYLATAGSAAAQQPHFWLQADPSSSELGTSTNATLTLRAGESRPLYLWMNPASSNYGLDGVSFDVRLVSTDGGTARASLLFDLPPGRWTGATGGIARTDLGGEGVDDANAFDLTNTNTLPDDAFRLATLQLTGINRGIVRIYLCIGGFGIADGGANAVVWLGFAQAHTAPETLNISGGVPGLCSSVPEATLTVLPALPDFDGDGDIDQDDFGRFQACLTGPAVTQSEPACAPALLDDDLDVDQADFDIFQGCMSGPNHAADPACTD